MTMAVAVAALLAGCCSPSLALVRHSRRRSKQRYAFCMRDCRGQKFHQTVSIRFGSTWSNISRFYGTCRVGLNVTRKLGKDFANVTWTELIFALIEQRRAVICCLLCAVHLRCSILSYICRVLFWRSVFIVLYYICYFTRASDHFAVDFDETV